MIVAWNWSRHARGVVGGDDHVAAAAVDLVRQGQRDRLARDRDRLIAVHRDDAVDVARLAGGQHADTVARQDRARCDRAGEAAEVLVRTVDPLHRHAERLVLQHVLDLDVLEVFHQGGALVPGHALVQVDDVVALERRHRDRDDALEAELLGEGPVLLDDAVEHDCP